MGQKINPIIFRLSKTNNWKSKYFEKKYSESVVYNFKDIEIRKFVTRFFEYNGLTIHNIKISYFNNTLHIFASYFSTLRTISLINTNNKNKKIRIVAKNVNTKNYKEYIKVKKNINKYIKYEELNYIKNNFFYNKKIIINKEKQDLKLRRLRGLKYYKNYLSTEHYKDIFNIYGVFIIF